MGHPCCIQPIRTGQLCERFGCTNEAGYEYNDGMGEWVVMCEKDAENLLGIEATIFGPRRIGVE